MSFISLEYIAFFVIVIPIYFIIPLRLRPILLGIASYIFYSFTQLNYILIIAFSTFIDYFIARQIASTPEDKKQSRQLLLSISIITNLGILFTFKYFNFFTDSINSLLVSSGNNALLQTHNLILPIGISFYTFQSMAYTIDVYRGKIEAEKNLSIFATYIAFFPQLVAGPIERASNLLPQFRQKFIIDYERIVAGLRLILWGAFKKIVIADQLAIYVNGVYNNVNIYSGIPLILATVFFTFQIYCDFSGYSDIAIGSAKIMGFDLMENFRRPYFSRSIREFWQRWHISLSTWFRDYLYIPLGGNRVSFIRNLLNLMTVFIVSGLWHGANWTFIIWGLLHGLYIVIETLIRILCKRVKFNLPEILQVLMTFIPVVFAWIFFRANTVNDAFYVASNLLSISDGFSQIYQPLTSQSVDKELVGALLALILMLLIIEWFQQKPYWMTLLRQKTKLRWAIYYSAVIFIYISIALAPTNQQFIYFQF